MKYCNKCTRTLPLERFSKGRSECVQCAQARWADYSARSRGVAPPSELALAFNGWRGVVTRGALSPTLGLRS
jgi:hypothetical protein